MKRLIKKAFGKELYHGTSIDSFLSIINNGAIYPQEKKSSDWTKIENIDYYFNGNEEEYHKHMDNYEGFTFFTTSYYLAKFYGERAQGKSNIKDAYVILDADISENALMPDLNDSPDAKTWQDSARDVGQVCVLGPITTNYITGLTFVFTNIHVEVETTIANWKNDVKKSLAQEVRHGYLDLDYCIDLWDKLDIPHKITKEF